MTPIPMNCHCRAKRIWVEMNPDVDRHRYSVRCSKCGKQAKWASVTEFKQAVDEGSDDLFLSWAEQVAPKPDGLAAFVSDS